MNKTINSNDVDKNTPNPDEPKHGEVLRKLVETRQQQLELVLAQIPKEKSEPPETRADIETALSALKALMTGDLNNIPDVVAEELTQWLETSKYLGAKEVRHIAKVAREAPTVKTAIIEDGDPADKAQAQ